MKRKEFLKSIGLSGVMLPILAACGRSADPAPVTSITGTCTSTPEETEGPFPTKDPSSLSLVDIRSDRTGVPFIIKITIQNKNSNCAGLEGLYVDIWHCDKDGYYSEYGGTGMQSVNLTAYHFLRGRQITDKNGQVGFTSIFPGWYSGRAPHIHVHVYDAAGKSLLITQIAIPTDVCNTVYTTANSLYTKGKQDTANADDNVFSDSLPNELALVTGNITDGYTLTHIIVVSV